MQLIPHLCPDHQAMKEMFSLLRPNANLSSGILFQQKAIRSNVDRSTTKPRNPTRPKPPQPPPQDHAAFDNLNSNVTLETLAPRDSELSNSFTASNEVSPIKRVWSLGRTRALGRIHSDSLQTIHSAQPYIQPNPMANRPLPSLPPPDLPNQDGHDAPWGGFSSPPPLPPHRTIDRPPPVPSRTGSDVPSVAPHRGRLAYVHTPPVSEQEDTIVPPPIPSRGCSAAPPPIPLRGSSNVPPPVPRREIPASPPPVPARENSHGPPLPARDVNGGKRTSPPDSPSQVPWIYSDMDREEESIPPLEFRTPSSSIVVADTSLLSTPLWEENHSSPLPDIPPRNALDDSDSSDGYATPSPTFPTESLQTEEAAARHSPRSDKFGASKEDSPVMNGSGGGEEELEQGDTDELEESKLKVSCLRRGASLTKAGVESSGELADSLEQSQDDLASGAKGKPNSLPLQSGGEGMGAPPTPPNSQGNNEAVIPPGVGKERRGASLDSAGVLQEWGGHSPPRRTKNISQCSIQSNASDTSSLMITKAVSEYGSIGSLSASLAEDASSKPTGLLKAGSEEDSSVGGRKGEERTASPQANAVDDGGVDKDGIAREETERTVRSATPVRPDDKEKAIIQSQTSDNKEDSGNFEEDFMNENNSQSPSFHDISESASEGDDALPEVPERKASTMQQAFPYTLSGHSRADTWMGRKISLPGSEEVRKLSV